MQAKADKAMLSLTAQNFNRCCWSLEEVVALRASQRLSKPAGQLGKAALLTALVVVQRTRPFMN